MRNDQPHAYEQQTHGGGACAACGRPPESSLHTYTLPGFEEFITEPEPAPELQLSMF